MKALCSPGCARFLVEWRTRGSLTFSHLSRNELIIGLYCFHPSFNLHEAGIFAATMILLRGGEEDDRGTRRPLLKLLAFMRCRIDAMRDIFLLNYSLRFSIISSGVPIPIFYLRFALIIE